MLSCDPPPLRPPTARFDFAVQLGLVLITSWPTGLSALAITPWRAILCIAELVVIRVAADDAAVALITATIALHAGAQVIDIPGVSYAVTIEAKVNT